MKFKDDIIESRFPDMHKAAQGIAIDAADFLMKAYGVEMMITATVSTLAEDKALGRLSDTHRTRRAFDVRTSNMEEDQIGELIIYLNRKYGKLGAIASALPILVVNKPHGTGPHLHIQLNRKHAKQELTYGQEKTNR